MRVMILEDDPWIADLLKQIVLSLRPGVHVACLGNVADALLDWQQHAADLVIADWNLPDDPGTLLLERIRRDNRQVPLVMITGRADRNSVMEVRPLGISAFISKPFQVPKVLECLERLLPPVEDSPATQASTSASLSDHLAEPPAKDLDLPLQPGMLDDLQPDPAVPPSLQVLGERWQFEPAPLQTAAALHRIGELCVLHHAQLWQNAGSALGANPGSNDQTRLRRLAGLS
jgi:CheY-like chemotaxis protein